MRSDCVIDDIYAHQSREAAKEMQAERLAERRDKVARFLPPDWDEQQDDDNTPGGSNVNRQYG